MFKWTQLKSTLHAQSCCCFKLKWFDFISCIQQVVKE